jgi:type II secretory pathway component GspD/PulD (secretin)
MKRLALLLLFCASLVRADDRVSLFLDDVRLPDLVKLVYGEVVRAPFVMTAEALKADARVSISLRDAEKSAVARHVESLLHGAGFSAQDRAGVVWIEPRPEQKEEEGEYVYRPRNRSVSYLLDLLAPFFKPGSFAQQRGLANQQQQPAMVPAGAVQSVKPQQQPQQVKDTGSSVYSMLDKSPDVLVFRGNDKDRARLLSLLDQLDTATPELLVKAVVYEVTTDGTQKSALSLAFDLLGSKLGVKLGQAVPGDFSAVFKNASIELVFDALNSDRRFKTVSSPTLRVQSGASARIVVGNETPVLGNAQMDRNGNPVQSVEYRPSGVILDLKPQVREGVADLQISQQISDFIATTNGVNSSPTLIKRELSTQVGIRPDDVLVIGGLDQDSTTHEGAGLPFLPDWLSSSSRKTNKSEVLMILQAQRI